MLTTLTNDQLRQATAIRDSIEALEAKLNALLQETAAPVAAERRREGQT